MDYSGDSSTELGDDQSSKLTPGWVLAPTTCHDVHALLYALYYRLTMMFATT